MIVFHERDRAGQRALVAAQQALRKGLIRDCHVAGILPGFAAGQAVSWAGEDQAADAHYDPAA
jgi:hypothetical protein